MLSAAPSSQDRRLSVNDQQKQTMLGTLMAARDYVLLTDGDERLARELMQAMRVIETLK
jgi:hypothetical protein